MTPKPPTPGPCDDCAQAREYLITGSGGWLLVHAQTRDMNCNVRSLKTEVQRLRAALNALSRDRMELDHRRPRGERMNIFTRLFRPKPPCPLLTQAHKRWVESQTFEDGADAHDTIGDLLELGHTFKRCKVCA